MPPIYLTIYSISLYLKKGNGLGGKSDHNQLLLRLTALNTSPNIYYPAKDFAYISLHITKSPQQYTTSRGKSVPPLILVCWLSTEDFSSLF